MRTPTLAWSGVPCGRHSLWRHCVADSPASPADAAKDYLSLAAKPRDTGALGGRYPAIDAIRNEPGRLEISGQRQINHTLGEHVETPATVRHPSHQCNSNPVT